MVTGGRLASRLVAANDLPARLRSAGRRHWKRKVRSDPGGGLTSCLANHQPLPPIQNIGETFEATKPSGDVLLVAAESLATKSRADMVINAFAGVQQFQACFAMPQMERNLVSVHTEGAIRGLQAR